MYLKCEIQLWEWNFLIYLILELRAQKKLDWDIPKIPILWTSVASLFGYPHSSKYLLCLAEESNSYRFGTT